MSKMCCADYNASRSRSAVVSGMISWLGWVCARPVVYGHHRKLLLPSACEVRPCHVATLLMDALLRAGEAARAG